MEINCFPCYCAATGNVIVLFFLAFAPHRRFLHPRFILFLFFCSLRFAVAKIGAISLISDMAMGSLTRITTYEKKRKEHLADAISLFRHETAFKRSLFNTSSYIFSNKDLIVHKPNNEMHSQSLILRNKPYRTKVNNERKKLSKSPQWSPSPCRIFALKTLRFSV